MTNRYLALIFLVFLVVAGGILLVRNKNKVLYSSNPTPVVTKAKVKPTQGISTALSVQNKSGESGLATATQKKGKVVITVKLIGFPKDIPQPSHLHLGSCKNLGEIKYPLSNVVNGESVTMLDINMKDFLSELPLALNVHKSNDEVKVYTACGDMSQGK